MIIYTIVPLCYILKFLAIASVVNEISVTFECRKCRKYFYEVSQVLYLHYYGVNNHYDTLLDVTTKFISFYTMCNSITHSLVMLKVS